MAIRADRTSCNCTLADCIVRILMQLHMTMRTASEIAPEILLLCKNSYAVGAEKTRREGEVLRLFALQYVRTY
jgi:hypothetical protein